jgi:phosphoribosylamine--glycine ligase
MRILVVGKGGREHAIITALHESPTETEIFSFPGSDAIFEIAKPVDASDLPTLGEFIRNSAIELVIAGEESYLVKDEGLAAVCAAAGVPCWGPPKESAQLEASKDFAKQFMLRHDIPTAKYALVNSTAEGLAAIEKYPVVLKFDGLAAGKGVVICQDEAASRSFLEEVFDQRKFGAGSVLVEECLVGPEISIFAAVADSEYLILAPARDYKRIGENDEGLNTGGMGAVSCRSGMIDQQLLAEIEETAVKRTIEGLIADGLPYRGFLYFGLMLTEDGPKMLEYNCRFGDPEAQAVLPLIEGDFTKFVDTGARGKIDPSLISFSDAWSVCVILASAGYPESSHSGDVISGLDSVSDARVFHAGTRKNDAGQFETAGGRVLAVVARGSTRVEAVDAAHTEAAKIDFDGSQRRSDIGRLHF